MSEEVGSVNDEEEEGGSSVPTLELAKSYAAFASKAIRKRPALAISVFLAISTVLMLALAVWPRSYHSETKLMAQSTYVLDTATANNDPLRGAANVVLRRDNVKAIVDKVELAAKWEGQRAPLLRFFDNLRVKLLGPIPPDVMMDTLVTTVGSKLEVGANPDGTLSISIDWPSADMAARLVDIALQTFLEARHVTEIGTLEEKIAILDSHATTVRGEIDSIAEQLQRLREDQLAKAQKAGEGFTASSQPAGSSPPTTSVTPRRPASAAPTPDLALPILKEQLETKKKRLADMEGDRSRRLSDAEAKAEDLKTKLTAEHPLVVQAQKAVELYSSPSSESTALSREIKALGDDIAAREASGRTAATGGGTYARSGDGSGSSGRTGASTAPPAPSGLPTAVLELLQQGVGVDPTVTAQLQTAVAKYSELTEDITTARVTLDSAQAEFQHRYKIVVPPQIAKSPSKPAVGKIAGIGLVVAMALALILPLLLELKRGVIVETWQVHMLQLPILAELKLPPRSD